MQFNSITFLVFFVIVLISYLSISSWKARKLVLLLSSYIFYMAWNPPFVILIWVSTIADWLLARQIAIAKSLGAKRTFLIMSVIVNLGILGFFKYGGFLLENFIYVLGIIGIEFVPSKWNIILPIGISFYTFQTMSYTIDVYRERIQPKYSLLDFSLFVTFFPQLVAGPIVRARYFLPQLDSMRKISSSQIGWGLSLLVIGLFSKIVLADSIMAPVVNTVYSRPEMSGSVEAWMAVLAFSGQIFFDFSGYSTCAIGTAMCFGFSLPDNFRSPYAALGFSDFWRRWHISLSSWIRDYLYIPVGGSKKGVFRTMIALLTVMVLGGLWHGASWLFVLWGGLHGIFLVIEHVARKIWNEYFSLNIDNIRLPLIMLTFAVVSLTWIPFRSQDLATAQQIISVLFIYKPTGLWPGPTAELSLLVVFGLFLWHLFIKESSLEYVASKLPWWGKAIVLEVLVVTIIFSSGNDSAFIYFQF